MLIYDYAIVKSIVSVEQKQFCGNQLCEDGFHGRVMTYFPCTHRRTRSVQQRRYLSIAWFNSFLLIIKKQEKDKYSQTNNFDYINYKKKHRGYCINEILVYVLGSSTMDIVPTKLVHAKQVSRPNWERCGNLINRLFITKRLTCRLVTRI